MARPLFLGNGSMLVGLDEFAMVHDFYYPYVGLESHCNARSSHHRIGVWVDGDFSWLDDGTWTIRLDYEEDAMLGMSTAHNDRLGVSLEFHDFVDHSLNVFGRNIHIVNNREQARQIRLFMHQVFRIRESSRGDTALYVPEDGYILDYKDRRSFIIYGQDFKTHDPFDQYSIGIHGIEGHSGTYADAEDGDLSGNPVEHGVVDSTVRFTFELEAHSSHRIQYWIAAGNSHADAKRLHDRFVGDGFQKRFEETQHYWAEWFKGAESATKQLEHKYAVPLKKSLSIMKSHMDRRGAVLASGDSEMLNYARDNYSYCWPRDASFVLWPLIRLGYTDEAKAYFEFARDVLSDNGSLMHKFQPDRAVGSSWHPLLHKGNPELAIQEDETAITIYMIGQYLEYSDDVQFVKRFYPTLIQKAANFLENYIDDETKLPHASYDLWEEKFLTSTYTVASTYAALKTAAKIAERFEYPDDAIRWQTMADEMRIAASGHLFDSERGYLIKGYLLTDNGKEVDTTLDVSSLYGAFVFDLFDEDSEEITRTLEAIEKELLDKSPSNGSPRYFMDNYCRPDKNAHVGNPWFVTTLWLAQIYKQLGREDDMWRYINWSIEHMTKSGMLSEQIHPETGAPLSVSPLIWSQAEFVNTLLDSLQS